MTYNFSGVLKYLISVLLLFVVTAWAQNEYGSISGEVRIPKSDHPGRILVELQLYSSTVATTYCDVSGTFGFSLLPANPYHVVIRDDRFYPVDELAMVDPAVSPTTAVHVNLVRRQDASTKGASERVAGSNPYIVDLSEYRHHFPKDAIKEFDKGVNADKDKNIDSAIRHYEKAIKVAPDFYPAHNNLGSDYLGKSNFAAAEKEFRESIRLNQSDSQAYFNLGNVLVLTKQYPQAETILHEGLQRRPDSAFGHFLLGSLCSRTGQLPEAEQNLKQALELDPTMSQTYLQLVNLYVQENRRADAIARLQAFLHAFPDGPYTMKAKEVLKRLESSQNRAP